MPGYYRAPLCLYGVRWGVQEEDRIILREIATLKAKLGDKKTVLSAVRLLCSSPPAPIRPRGVTHPLRVPGPLCFRVCVCMSCVRRCALAVACVWRGWEAGRRLLCLTVRLCLMFSSPPPPRLRGFGVGPCPVNGCVCVREGV